VIIEHCFYFALGVIAGGGLVLHLHDWIHRLVS
jgi:hypothetical protein